MMGWEEPLMKEHVRLMCDAHPKTKAGEGLNILNIGYGLGIVSPTPLDSAETHILPRSTTCSKNSRPDPFRIP
jgi:hypothetical protein